MSMCSTEEWREISLRMPPSPPPKSSTYKLEDRKTKNVTFQ